MAVQSKVKDELWEVIGNWIADNIKEKYKTGEFIEAFAELTILTINNAEPESRNALFGHAIRKLNEFFYDRPTMPVLH
jgi:hypothetical protein